MFCCYLKNIILFVVGLLLLLVNLGVGMGVFGEYVVQWWPAGLVLYAVLGFFCGGVCKRVVEEK